MNRQTSGLTVKANGDLRTFTISSGAEDREGDVLEPTGIVTTAYMRNPVVLWAHDYYSPPIGKTVGAIRATMDGKLRADVTFAPSAFAQEVKTLVDAGFIKAASVGFSPLLPGEPRYNAEGWQSGLRYTSWELLEWSICAVPANPDALALAAKAKGLQVPMLERATHEQVIRLPWWATPAHLRGLVGQIVRETVQQVTGIRGAQPRRKGGELTEEQQAEIADVARRLKPPRGN